MTKARPLAATHDGQARDGWTQRRIDRLFFSCVKDGRFDLSDLITHRFAPQACATAYAIAEQQREQVMGILYDWTDAGGGGPETGSN